MEMPSSRAGGFTLIELLVVVAIIGVISSVALASFNSSRATARDTERIAELRQMVKALELYHTEFGAYPSTGGAWHGGRAGCYGGHGYGSTGYIPGLVPKFVETLPEDPRASGSSCYLYRSNGTDYMMLAHQTIETFDPDIGPHPMDRPLANQQTIAVYTPGARNW